ncbi:ABC transporter substrate-binding protein [Okibacterium fritillariae]|uniref:ABC transporter substrate-binding protein n=1 Tax=Okibacterium fritillariae TaxID=123320 RepID=UPI0040554374
MRSPRILAAAGTVAAAALVLTACTPGGGSSESGSPDADATVNVGLVLEPTDLDIRTTDGIALDQVLIDNVYEGLVSRTAAGEIVDTIAKSHEVSDDGLTYTFDLNDGVTFQNGDEVTADDVVWSISQVKDDEGMQGHTDLANVTSITATDDDTVTLALSAPDSNLLWNLAGRAGLVLDEAATNDLSTTAVGTGPYTLKSWKQGDSLTLERNDDYWGEKARVKSVVFRYITDANAGINAMLAGDLDVQTAVDANLATQFDGNADIEIARGKTTDKYTLAFNNKVAPLNDVRVRQAIRMAIDHAAVVKAVGGAAVEQGGPIPELDPGYEDLTDVAPYDPTKAKELLAEAGQSNLTLDLTIPSFYGTSVATLLVSELEKVGITLNVKSVEFATWLNDVYTNKDFQLSYVDHAESRDFGNWANPDYYFGFDNADVQRLYQESVAAADPETAAAKLKEAARIVSEQAGADWLYNAVTLTAVRKGVTGFPTDSTSTRLDLGELAVKE